MRVAMRTGQLSEGLLTRDLAHHIDSSEPGRTFPSSLMWMFYCRQAQAGAYRRSQRWGVDPAVLVDGGV
jgi:hypothetical protein